MPLHCYFHILGLFLLFVSSASARQDYVSVGKFSDKSLSGWQEKQFAGNTQYSFYDDKQKGWVVQGKSEGSASGLLKEISVDIGETPFLNWVWRVEKLPGVEDEKSKGGDDYAARVYVIFKTGSWFWNTKALNYVWNSNYPVGETWPNAFTANAQVMALRSKDSPLGEWVAEKRNIQKDIVECFGIEVENIEALAIMTDTDNSGSRAVAYYGDIFFSSK
jgi:hypothetical protein